MSQFSYHYRLTSWAGLASSCNESASKKKSVKISRTGISLKPALVEVAPVAMKDTNCDYYSIKYKQISKGRGKKRDSIAIARKDCDKIRQKCKKERHQKTFLRKVLAKKITIV